MVANTTSPIFVHSLFRSGSTYIYNALKRTNRYHIYHEPFHEAIGSLADNWDDLYGRTGELKDSLRHGFLEGSYFDEYAHLLPYLHKVFDQSVSYELFFLNREAESAPLKKYIECLIQGANARPVIQCTRTIGRIEWLKAQYPSAHVFLLRNPWDQWYSYKVDHYISATPQLIFSQPCLPQVLAAVSEACGFKALSGHSLQDQIEHSRHVPLDAESDYFLFFGLWTYAITLARSNCDLLLDMDAISRLKPSRIDAEKRLADLGLSEVSLQDCELHRSIFRPEEAAFFKHIEAQVLEIFKRHGYDANTIHDYLNREREVSFIEHCSSVKRRRMALDDAPRLRALLLRSDENFSRIAKSLKHQLNDRENSATKLGNALSGQQQDILRLTNETLERDKLASELEKQLNLARAALVERDAEISTIRQSAEESQQYCHSIKQTLSGREEEISALTEVLGEKQRETRSLEQAIAQASNELLGMKAAVSEKNEQLATLKVTISDLRESVATLKRVLAVDAENRDQQLATRDRQLLRLNQTLAERNNEIALLNDAGLTQGDRISELSRLLADKDLQIAGLENSAEELRQQLASLNTDIADREHKVGVLTQALHHQDKELEMRNLEAIDAGSRIAHLNHVVEEHATTIKALLNSRSWKMTAPLRALSTTINQRPPAYRLTEYSTPGTAPGADAYFTICSKNFLAHARTLYQSLRPHYPSARFFLVLCDRVDGLFDPTQEPFEFVYLEDLQLPNLSEMAERYNITEFNTAVKPFAFSHLMTKHDFRTVVYLDPDLLVVDKMQELDGLLAGGAEAVLTPHILQPAERDEVHDGKMLLFGIYNLGFLALKNTADVRSFLSWWGRRLERECIIRLDQGLFVDQKWADLIPAFISGAQVLHHPGYNVAYWNLPQRKITRTGTHWFANGQPLRFVHFSGNKIDDPSVFSRHSQQVTINNIGVLRELLDYYRSQVFAQGHQFYRKLPYAFSWSGAAGQNLHTPESLDQATTQGAGAFVASARQSAGAETSPEKRPFRRFHTVRRALPVAQKLSGGWLPLARRTWGAYKRSGLGHVKTKIVELSRFPATLPVSPAAQPLPAPEMQKRKRLLYLDWAIPRPDQDAASVTAVMLVKIFHSLDYAVTFLPCSLKYEEGYYEKLVATGTEVICYPAIESTKDWLSANAKDFDVCIMARGPVVWPYLETLKTCAPNLRLVFNTVDLHYLRELRQAELANDDLARQSAMLTRDQEFELIRRCDLTIVLSTEELYLIRGEFPDAILTVLPVVFEDIPGATRSYGTRRDILFIGSFPHLPNIDAVIYFAEQVFPLIQRRIPDIRFKVVGANPPDSIVKLTVNPAIEVLGYVKELAPLFEGIRLSVAPLRYGAGIKGKIGSSLCFGVPCVATPLATEGMGLANGRNVLTGETPEEFSEAVCRAYLDEELWNHLSNGGHRFALENYSVSAIGQRAGDMLWAVTEGWQGFESAYEIADWNAFKHHSARMTNEYGRRILREQALLPQDNRESFHTEGFCCVCGRETEFLTSFMYATGTAPDGRPMPNWREHMQCRHCGLVNRVRAALNALHTLAPPRQDSRIYITEQLTSTYQWLSLRYPKLQGSEYYGSNRVPGTVLDGVRHEDVMALSFADSSFDRILSFDVIEHVPDPEKALREIYRVLAENGVFLFSVPFSATSSIDIVRATLNVDGTVEHHFPAEYHGNPVDREGGALCYRYFGWSLLDQLRTIGFSRVRVLAYWSERQGYLGQEQYLFIAHKQCSA